MPADDEPKERGVAYGLVPRHLWRTSFAPLSSNARLVAMLALTLPTGGICPVAQVYEAELLDLAGLSVRALRAALAELAEHDLVHFDRSAGVLYAKVGLIQRPPRGEKQVSAAKSGLGLVKPSPLVCKAREDIARVLVQSDLATFTNHREKGVVDTDTVSGGVSGWVSDTKGIGIGSERGGGSGSEPASPAGSPSKPSPTTTPEPTQAESSRGESHEEIHPKSESGETRQEIHEEDPPRAAPPPKPRKTGELAAVRKLVAHLGDPMLASRLRDAWCGGADLDIAVELYLAQLADQTGLRSPGAWLLAQVRRLHDDPDALEAFREQADEIRAERVRTAEREADRQRREAEREEREREAERQATERRAALEAEWAELYAKNALPGEPRAAFAWRVQDAQHSHDPRGFLVLQYQSATGRTMREAHADAAARGLSTELPASFPIRPARVA